MTAQPKSVIKSYFETGDKPTQAQFIDLIDSYQDAGAGGSVTGPASSVDSQIALFSGTGGTVLKAATTTGVLKAASGVLTTASSGTDYAPPTSGSSFLKGNGSGGFTNQSTINLTDLATQGANTVLAEATGSTAAPTAVALSTQQVLGRLGGNITGVTIGTSANNLVQLNGSAQLPAVDGSLLTGITGIPQATPVALSGTSSTITVDFTTYTAYKLLIDASAANGAVTIAMSSNGGSSYATSGYGFTAINTTTVTNVTTQIGAPSGDDWQAEITISQPSTSAQAYMKVFSAGDNNAQRYIGDVRSALTAAANRVRITVATSWTGYYTIIPIARR